MWGLGLGSGLQSVLPKNPLKAENARLIFFPAVVLPA